MLLTAGRGLATFVGAGAGVEAPGPGAARSPCRGPGGGHSNLRWQLAQVEEQSLCHSGAEGQKQN